MLNEILNWSERVAPMWQRDALRRLLKKGTHLEQEDYDQLYLLLKQARGIPIKQLITAAPLSATDLPNKASSGKKTSLVSITECQYVNNLPDDQTINFEQNGITVIYGPNASGKSGYARVLKAACRARDTSEQVYPNVHDEHATSAVPSATITVAIEGVQVALSWKANEVSPEQLADISVFDSRCARLYVTKENDVAYLPYGLDLMEVLSKVVIPQLLQRLESEISGIRDGSDLYEHLIDDTSTGKFLSLLSHETEIESIREHGMISETEKGRYNFLREALAESDPSAKASGLFQSYLRLKEIAKQTYSSFESVSESVVNQIQKKHQTQKISEQAAIASVEQLRSGEVLLPGSGGKLWKNLYNAAVEYALLEPSEQINFPPNSESDRCVLCQQEYTTDALARMHRFDEYISQEVAKKVEEAGAEMKSAVEALEATQVDLRLTAADDAELTELCPELHSDLKDSAVFLVNRKSSILEAASTGDWSEIEEMPQSPFQGIRDLAAAQLRESRSFRRLANQLDRESLTKEFQELKTKKSLAKIVSAVEHHVSGMKAKNKLEKCKEDLKTRPISDKINDLSSTAVTAALRQALVSEMSSLGMEQVNFRLDSRTDKGKVKHNLVLDVSTTNKIENILSEGEQRVLAIGAYLAELTLSNHKCGIIFDDPVSSLDHWRRGKVAKRLVQESNSRQVVIFTHDTTFLQQLRDEIRSQSATELVTHLEHRADRPGYIQEGLPWDHQGYKERLDELEKIQSQLKKLPWPQYPSPEECSRMREAYSKLRATIERIVQDVVFCGVITRYSDYVNVGRLPDVVHFEEVDRVELARLHIKCSNVTSAHDASSGHLQTVPSADDLGADIDALKGVVEQIKQKRNSAKSGTP